MIDILILFYRFLPHFRDPHYYVFFPIISEKKLKWNIKWRYFLENKKIDLPNLLQTAFIIPACSNTIMSQKEIDVRRDAGKIDVIETRIRTIRLIQKMEENEEYSKVLGLENISELNIPQNSERMKAASLPSNIKKQEVPEMYDYCPSCDLPLDGGEYTEPWEDGDNAFGYVTCPHCGYEVLLYGDDDD